MYRFKLKEIEVGDTEIRGGKKSTVTDIDPETGAISWDIADTADFSSTYKALQKAKDFLDTLEKEGKAKDDTTIDKFSEQIANLFNAFRTHVRKEYPKEYERVSRLKETALSDKLIEPFDKALKSGEIGLTKNKELIDKITQLMKGLKEGHGLDQGDLDYLQFIADKHPDDTKLEKIIKFLSKSNILVDKTKDLSKGKEVEEEKIKGADGKACWKGYRYAGTEDGKDKCVKVNEDSSEKLSIMKDENGKFIIGMAKGKYPRSKEAGPFDTQQKACEFFSEKGDVILKNLTEERLNEADINKLKIIGDIYSSCEIPVNEEEGERDVNTIAKYLPKINNKVEWGELLDKILNLEVPQLSDVTKKQALLKVIKQLKEEDVEEGEGMGYLTPRAFGKMKNNVYTSQYGYKLVPKKIKGSSLEVKQLFEYSDFQEGRISGFDKVEEKVNAISTLLSNAKNETVKFYNENPGSYAVVYSTDMVNELLDDIAEMLKQSK